MTQTSPPQDWRIKEYNGLKVYWTPELDGGGDVFAQDYFQTIGSIQGLPKFKRMYEWCAGPAFLGFYFLAHGLCETLCLADVYPPAIECVRKTIAENGLEDRVSIYLSDSLDDIPETEVWDLVISNPPHFVQPVQVMGWDTQRKTVDPDWEIHKRFYEKIRRHLAPNGLIALLENGNGSHVETFRPMIENNGLKMLHWQWSAGLRAMYYLYAARNDSPLRFT